MNDWKLVLDEAAFQFFISSRAVDRRRLLSAFTALRDNPNRERHYSCKDATGHDLSVWAYPPFLITYWLDAFVSEVRIVDIQKVLF